MNETPKLVPIGTKDDMKGAMEAFRRAAPDFIENARIIAKIKRAYFDALVKEGFTVPQAIELCKASMVV